MNIETEEQTQPAKKRHPNWGGARPGSGRPPSKYPKTKVSVSVSAEQFDRAINLWGGRVSHLIDKLVREYVAREAPDKQLES